jgi:hypothetical protein
MNSATATPSMTGTPFDVHINSKPLRLVFWSVLTEPARNPNELDKWEVTIRAQHSGVFVTMPHATGALFGTRSPDPAKILLTLAGDLRLALALPTGYRGGVDYLFREGYVTWPSEAIDLYKRLIAAWACAEAIVSGTDILVSEFAESLDLGNLLSVRTEPMHLMAVA